MDQFIASIAIALLVGFLLLLFATIFLLARKLAGIWIRSRPSKANRRERSVRRALRKDGFSQSEIEYALSADNDA